ncbi:MAG: PQQ-binding-like beta-propeller repeat protein [Kofleriaceae bacterium]|nr:PQQ-binding-like beta-propeller repeat protein [Kofleriaceae bacterium]MBP9205467.1 PQQ-binding-like beta-propeller repeat protein [Kofleriaceae bacterium]
MKRGLACLAALALVAGCGGTAAFDLTRSDNDRAALGRALARRQAPARLAPVGARPRVYAVLGGTPRQLLAFDLGATEPAWKVAAEVASRVVVGGDFVAAREGDDFVGRAADTGAPRWRFRIPGELAGASADGTRAYVVYKATEAGTPRWWLVALDGKSGQVSWKLDADGQLGAPAVSGGLVLSPFLTQWLDLVDAATGAPLTRIRGVDTQIGFAQASGAGAWFGSPQGLIRLDERAASGTRKDSSFLALPLPAQLSQATLAVDAYDPVQVGYTARDRARVLWRGRADGDGAALTGDGFAVHYFRYVLGYGVDGALRWAYSHPRVELVASAHAGEVLLLVSAAGELIALDAATGAARARVDLGAGAPVIGATFDGEGWTPAGATDPEAGTVAALVQIARDRDARFVKVKELAIEALARLSGAEVTTDLLGILGDDRTPPRLREAVGTVLVARRDPGGLVALAAALDAERDDVIAGTDARNVGVLAAALGALGGQTLDVDGQIRAEAALVRHLEAPTTDVVDLVALVRALGALASPYALERVRSHALLYRGDPELAGSKEWRRAVVGALGRSKDPIDRETLRMLGEDGRTQPDLATLAADAVE